MNTVVHRRLPSIPPSAGPAGDSAGDPTGPELPDPRDLPSTRALPVSHRLALRLALLLIVWSAHRRATRAPAVARLRRQLDARAARERDWARRAALTIAR